MRETHFCVASSYLRGRRSNTSRGHSIVHTNTNVRKEININKREKEPLIIPCSQCRMCIVHYSAQCNNFIFVTAVLPSFECYAILRISD